MLRASKSGYLEYWEGLGDHRLLWADIPLAQIFGVQTFESTKPHLRRLKCDDPRVVMKYVTRYYDYLVQHNLFSRASQLEQSVTEGQSLSVE